MTSTGATCPRCGHSVQRRPKLTERIQRWRGERVRRRCLEPTPAGRCACMEAFHDGSRTAARQG